jgi:hypothetical protein
MLKLHLFASYDSKGTATMKLLVTQHNAPYTRSVSHFTPSKYPRFLFLRFKRPHFSELNLSRQAKPRQRKSEYYRSRNHIIFFIHMLAAFSSKDPCPQTFYVNFTIACSVQILLLGKISAPKFLVGVLKHIQVIHFKHINPHVENTKLCRNSIFSSL